MKLTHKIGLGLFVLPFSLFANTQSIYCPQNHAYINVGMTQDQVISACGQPISQQDSNQPAMQKIPVQQLIYNNKGASTVFYGVWNIPVGFNASRLEIDLVNRKVKSIRLNGSNANAMSICGGRSIQPGDPVEKVYSFCGSPTLTNTTYMNVLIPTTHKPQVWIYQPGEYQPSVSLTFVNGRLQSIN